MTEVKILLVDDHAVVRKGYQRLIEQEPGFTVVAEAPSADAGYAAFVSVRPDLAVIDLSLPGASGFELIRRILAREPRARMIVFSMHEDGVMARRALDLGAKGYLTKSSAPEVLLAAIRAVAQGREFVSADIAAQLDHARHADDPVNQLSAKEVEVWRMVARGMPVAAIAQTLHLSPKTIANYQTQIKQKLNVETTAALTHLAIRHGLIPAA